MSFLDTIVAAFKGGGSNRVPIARGFTSPWASAYEPQGKRAPFDYHSAVREAYLANPVAQRSVRIVTEGVGGAPLAIDNAQLAALVACSCGAQPLMEVLAAHMLLHGDAYVQVVKDGAGQPVELFPLRPDRVSVVPGGDGWPVAYEYRLGGDVTRIAVEDDDGWPSIIHLSGFHPLDDHYGAGCLGAAEQAVAVHNAAAQWNRTLLENAARPSGALVYEPGDGASLSQAQFDRLKAELASAFQGSANAGRPMVLEGGLSWKAMSMSPADMDFATLKASAARDIALAFGVPPMLLGLPGDNTYANYREANRALWRLTLLPLAAKIGNALAGGLAAWFEGATIAVDLDRVPALTEDRERLWAQVSGADFLSAAEKRTLLNLPTEQDATP